MPKFSDPTYFGPRWLHRRQLGLPNVLGSKNLQCQQKYNYSDSFLLNKDSSHGAIFNLEYNPECTILAAATERKNVLLFDPLRCVPISVMHDAHTDCVNSIKFIDSNYFATCSDDKTVSIWDIRNLQTRLYNLIHHSNWVKNIEYSEKDKVFLSSGFDGSIFTWEWCGDNVCNPSKVFSVNGLMRSRLSNDGSKLVISTAGGFMIVVHNLNLRTIKADLNNFKPNIYRLMQLSQTFLHRNGEGTNLFRGFGKRNRIEFLSDFPEHNVSEIISSVQIHPEGNCVFSRNTSQGEESEWSCVHVIEECERDGSESEENMQVGWPTTAPKSQRPTQILLPRMDGEDDLTFAPNNVWEAVVAINQARNTRGSSRSREPLNIEYRFRNIHYEENETVRLQNDEELEESGEVQDSDSNAEDVEAVVPIGIYRNERSNGSSRRRIDAFSLRIFNDNAAGSNSTRGLPSGRSFLKLNVNKDIHQNYRRLMNYIQEPNVIPGFIKECSFSPDGRVICSPYGSSFRLLAFSSTVADPWNCVPDNPPAPLHVLWNKGQVNNDAEAVVSTKFSGLDNNLVIGTLSGSISIYYPFR